MMDDVGGQSALAVTVGIMGKWKIVTDHWTDALLTQ